MDLIEEMQRGVVIADGAMGTELWARGVVRDACLEELCVAAPELVAGIHRDYIAAGARIIRTASFGGNSVRLARHGADRRVGELNWIAAQLAREVARDTGARVAASVGPLGISAAEAAARGIDRLAVFIEQIGALLDGGAQLVMLETFTHLDELLLAIEAKQTLHHCPVVGSVACGPDGRLADGIALGDAFTRLADAGADIVGLNCIDPALAARLLAQNPAPGPVAVFANAGFPAERDGRLAWPVGPAAFAVATLALRAAGAQLLGGCCGTTPAHIAALAPPQ